MNGVRMMQYPKSVIWLGHLVLAVARRRGGLVRVGEVVEVVRRLRSNGVMVVGGLGDVRESVEKLLWRLVEEGLAYPCDGGFVVSSRLLESPVARRADRVLVASS